MRSFFTTLARELLPPVLKRTLRNAIAVVSDPYVGKIARELKRLQALPAMQPNVTKIFGRPFKVLDGHSFVGLYDAYFRRELYAFRSTSEQPFIIDCGANVGVSVLWWKTKYPDCRVLAFEADPAIFEILKGNCAGLSGVQLVNAALWDCDGEIAFAVHGGLGGYVQELSASAEYTSQTVVSMRLRPYLGQHCDLLKMDIEGAEVRVLRDCADVLETVDRMFVEYHSFWDKQQSLAETIGHLEKAGFRLHIHAELPSPQPFRELLKLNHKDLRLDLFAFREHAGPGVRTLKRTDLVGGATTAETAASIKGLLAP